MQETELHYRLFVVNKRVLKQVHNFQPLINVGGPTHLEAYGPHPER